MLTAFSNSLGSKAGEYTFKQAEAYLPAAPAPAAPPPTTSVAPAQPAPAIQMGSKSRLEGLTIDLGANAQVGILNDGVTGTSFKDVAIKNVGTAGVVNRDSRDLSFERVEIEMRAK
jgi:hypothetical protein